MTPEQVAALQAFNAGVGEQMQTQPDNTNTQPQPQHTNTATTIGDILTGATPIDRPARPEHNVPCTWPGCSRMFSCQHNVEQHIREKHTKVRPYPCPVCGADFARPGTMYRHMRSQHSLEPDIKNPRPRRRVLQDRGPISAASTPQSSTPRRSGRGAIEQSQPVHTAESMPMNMLLQPAFHDFSSCHICGQQLTGTEHASMHNHLEHGVPASADCGCSFCRMQLSQQAPQQQFEPMAFQQQPAPQAQTQPIYQPQPYRPISPAQFEQQLHGLQQPQPAQAPEPANYPPPIDPPVTPGPEPQGQDSFGFIDYSQFATGEGFGFGELPNNLDDLFPELHDVPKTGDDMQF